MKVPSVRFGCPASSCVTVSCVALTLTLCSPAARADGPAILDVKAAVLRGAPTEALTGGSEHFAILGETRARYVEVPAYSSADRRLTVVVKQYDKVAVRLIDWPEDEFMYFLDGHVTIEGTDGHAKTYGPGDAIVIPKGFTGTWKQRSRIRMYTVSYTAQP